MSELDQCHSDQQSHVQGELRKEMGMLQKKILMDTVRQQEGVNFCEQILWWKFHMFLFVK